MRQSRVVGFLVLIVALAGAYWWWQGQRVTAPVADSVPPPPVAAPALAPAASVPAPTASAPAQPAIKHPLPSASEATASVPLPSLDESDAWLKAPLEDLLGRKNMLRFLQLDGLVRRIVVTVDNLGREHAPLMAWPVAPTPGRFSTLPAKNGGTEVINPDNAQRYTPLVQFIESVDSARAVALYVRLYPLFQQAYAEAGFPKGYFNDRLVAVIDLLLATPVQEGPLSVALVDVKGPIAPLRPWVRYEYIDPALESLAAGQKMLIRTGAVNQRRLQAKLRELRGLIVKAGKPAATAPAPVRPASAAASARSN
jgi:hypothetical protein